MIALALALAVAQPIEVPTSPSRTAPIRVQMDSIATGSLVTLLLRDIMRVPYVIAPDVLQDRRPTSVSLVIPREKVPERVVSYLRGAGFNVRLSGGTVYVTKAGRGSQSSYSPSSTQLQNPEVLGRGSTPASDVPYGSPVRVGGGVPFAGDYRRAVPDGPPPEAEGRSPPSYASADAAGSSAVLVGYVPAHRDPAYFAEVIGGLLPALKFGARGSVKGEPAQGTISPSLGPDVLVMSGSVADIARARRLVVMLDRPRPLVAVKAVVMQLQNVHARGSALSILASFAGGKVRVGSYGADAPASQFVRIGAGAISAVLSAVREDSRFKVVATPNLSALSGAVATMNAGSQVPTVGAVSIAEGGTPVQSIVYRDSGITLTVRPVVRGDVIELDVSEERSTFVRTTTGVEDSPTLQRSSASASVALKSGESVALAGLTEQSDGQRREGLFGGLLGVRGRDKTDSELVVLISAEVVPPPSTSPGEFLEVDPSPELQPSEVSA